MIKPIPAYTMGVGDRFGKQGKAQLQTLADAWESSIEVCPVWNKSFREHSIVGSAPADVRQEADAAVAALGWKQDYFVDADHISLKTVDGFIESSDFFTLDVADAIGEVADTDDVTAFIARHPELCGSLDLPGLNVPITLSSGDLRGIVETYLFAVQEAGRIYRHIAESKAQAAFVTEVSMDETDKPQTPDELLVILALMADEGIPAQTVAPRFSGRFNKGVDYVGDPADFDREFCADLVVVKHAIAAYGLPETLKLSVHSGSDKFSIYPGIARALRETGAGLHLKTAGTTWLEELIGLAEAGGDGLAIACEIYRGAVARFDELCGPYADVIDINRDCLPTPDMVEAWTGPAFANALRHDSTQSAYNPNFRQLLHVGYKLAAEMGPRYGDALDTHADVVAHHVRQNLLVRHIRAVFPEA